ncbi:MAG: DUF2182 domain-containing protein [Pseudomonadota bacterium]
MSGALRARLSLGLVLGGLLACAWWYLAGMHMAPPELFARMSRAHASPWTLEELIAVFIMWSVMMSAMMLPAAAPMVFTYGRLIRGRGLERHLRLTLVFVAGYVLVWAIYSLLAAAAQLALQRAALLSAGGWSTDSLLSAALLAVAGLFQFSRWKYACLDKCRTPVGFLLYEWRPGSQGALMMGARHGLYCVGCCWAYMALMFVLGVMNVWWMLALTAFVVVEKLAPAPVLTGRIAGVVALGGAVAVWSVG